jgi:Zn-dependent peptidase ImmA (M78 family)/transcriptional regulator with XRE-family HTH domain
MDRIPVEPTVLQWARESGGFQTVDAAAKKLGVSARTVSSWESGDLQPTIKQLRAVAKAYRRPLAVLLLSVPPRDFDALRDFRITSSSGETAPWSPALQAEFRRGVSQREVYLELKDVAPNSVPENTSRFRFRRADDPEGIGLRMRDLLGMDSWSAAMWSKPRELLNRATTAVEQLGILVIHTRDIKIDEMRGFSITEWPYPVIALNGSDWPRPRLFTLLHELTHLGLNAGGLCDLHEEPRRGTSAADDVERFCNAVAAAALMPRDRVLADPAVAGASSAYAWSLDELEALSHRYGASSEAVLLRLIGLGKASWELYRTRKVELDERYAEARRVEKAKRKESDGGPSYYVVKARDLGHGYVGSVLDAYQSRQISSLDVVDFLSVRYDQLGKLQEALRS